MKRAKIKKKQRIASQNKAPVNLELHRKQLRTSLREASWRKAYASASAILGADDFDADLDENPCAIATEMYLRELIADRRKKQVRILTEAVKRTRPDLILHWPLGLQVAAKCLQDIGAEPANPDFLARLKREIHDPAELENSDYDPWREDAESILKAWELVEQRCFPAARETLASISRRSPLVDWRLFLQTMIASCEGDARVIDQNLKLMTPHSPASELANALYGTDRPADCMDYQAAKAVLARGVNRSDIEQLVSTLPKHFAGKFEAVLAFANNLQAQGKIELGVVLLAAFFEASGQDACTEAEQRLTDLAFSRASSNAIFHLRYLVRIHVLFYIRDEESSAVAVATLAEIGLNPGHTWSRHERAVIISIAGRYFPSVADTELFEPLHGMDDFVSFAFFKKCIHEGLKYWPNLEDLYESWILLEQECGARASVALAHWHRSDAGNVGILIRYIRALIEEEDYRNAENALKKLGTYPGEKKTWNLLRSKSMLYQCRDLFFENARSRLSGLTKKLEGILPETLAEIEFMTALSADNREPVKQLIETAAHATGNPWKAFFQACYYLESKMESTLLPETILADLLANPVASAEKLIEALKSDNCVLPCSPSLYPLRDALGDLFRFLDDPGMIVQLFSIIYFHLNHEARHTFAGAVDHEICSEAAAKLLKQDHHTRIQGLIFMAAVYLSEFNFLMLDGDCDAQLSSYSSILTSLATSQAVKYDVDISSQIEALSRLDRFYAVCLTKIELDRAEDMVNQLTRALDQHERSALIASFFRDLTSDDKKKKKKSSRRKTSKLKPVRPGGTS